MGSAQCALRKAAGAALVALAFGCAGVDPAPPPSPFLGVRKVALLRRANPEARRSKDPLDAVAESLAAKGVEVRFVSVDGPGADEKSATRLFDDVEARVASVGSSPAAHGRLGRSLGEVDARLVRALGVDAVVTYHRFRGIASDPFPPSAGPNARPQVRSRAAGALGIVGAAGELLAFDWGPHDAVLEPDAAETPAEAVDAAVRALTGEPDGV